MDAGFIRGFVELVAALMLPIGAGLVFWELLRSNRGIGRRAIQYTAVVMLLPLIMILSLEKVIDANLVAVLIAALAGYLLGGVSSVEAIEHHVREASEPAPILRRELNVISPDGR
jgi:hypothetical protein